MTQQLTLPIDLPEVSDFANFVWGDNLTIKAALEHFITAQSDPIMYLYGAPGVGLTHLLMGCCHFAGTLNRRAAYVSLSDAKKYGPGVLEGVENVSLVCIDNIDMISGCEQWEEAMFHCYNRVLNHQGQLIVAAQQTPSQLGVTLPDLASRLAAGSVYHVKTLSDDDKMLALKSRAILHGLEMGDEVAKYLLHHSERNTKKLFEQLSKLEKANLVHQRRLTIPFVKEVI